MIDPSRASSAAKAAMLHFAVSGVVAAIAAALVFFVWYPFPFRDLAGGSVLFGILIGVDVVCGPLLTAIVFNPMKPRRELVADLSFVAALQIAALVYGLYSIGVARPVILAFEVDRFVVVSASQIDSSELPLANESLRSLSWTGPVLVGTRGAKDGPETLLSIELSLRGKEPSIRPDWWQQFELSRSNAISRMKPLVELRRIRTPDAQATIDDAVKRSGAPIERLFYLPLVSQHSLDGWIAIMDERATIVAYAPVGGF